MKTLVCGLAALLLCGCALQGADAERWLAKVERYLETGEEWNAKAATYLEEGKAVVSGVRAELKRDRKAEGKAEPTDAMGGLLETILVALGVSTPVAGSAALGLNWVRNLTRARDLSKVQNGTKTT